MTLEQKIESTKNEIGHVLHNVRSAFVNVRALQAIRDQRLTHMNFQLQQHPAPQVLHIPNSSAHPVAFARSEEAHNYSSLLATLAVWETSAEFLEAEAILQPLLDELARLEASKLAADQAEARRLQAVADAKEKALAEATAKIEADFAEPSPEPALEPPAPFRGKNIRPALATA